MSNLRRARLSRKGNDYLTYLQNYCWKQTGIVIFLLIPIQKETRSVFSAVPKPVPASYRGNEAYDDSHTIHSAFSHRKRLAAFALTSRSPLSFVVLRATIASDAPRSRKLMVGLPTPTFAGASSLVGLPTAGGHIRLNPSLNNFPPCGTGYVKLLLFRWFNSIIKRLFTSHRFIHY